MNILLQTKQDAEVHFGKKAIMAPNLLGMVGEGEKAFGFLTGDISQGFEITVGFFNEKARYVAFKKRTGTTWGEGDLRASLMQIGKYSDWSVKSGAEFFDYAEKVGKKSLPMRPAGKVQGGDMPSYTCQTCPGRLGWFRIKRP